MSDLTFISRFDYKNVGDAVSSPLHYFDFPGLNCIRLQYEQGVHPTLSTNTIVGGGMYQPEFTSALLRQPYKVIFWGVGLASIELKPREYLLPNRGLYSTRAWDQGYRWVPCASCMSKLFDQTYEIKNEYAVYEAYKKASIKLPFPKMTNDRPFEEVIKFLGEAESVITSSYHGAYWGILLKRRVYMLNVGNIKGRFLKWQPKRMERPRPISWERKTALVYDEALDEAREANKRFHIDVLDYISS